MKRSQLSGCKYLSSAGLIGCLLLISSGWVLGQEPSQPQPNTREQVPAESKEKAKEAPKEKVPYQLTVKKTPLLNLSLKAEKANFSEVSADLSKRLKVPVVVGPGLQKELLSIEFSELPLEAALQLMAPSVYVDYQIDTGVGTAPKVLGIFFMEANQGEPPVTAVIQSSTQSLLVEGDTEDGVEPTTDEAKKKLEEQPLRVEFKDGLISVKAKRQPLVLVLLKIGEVLAIPVEILSQPNDVIDADISRASIEDAVRQLSPNLRLFLRADLTHSHRRALRLVLPEAATTTQGFEQ